MLRDESPENINTIRWTLEDNLNSAKLGWIISNTEGSEIQELYSLNGLSPHNIFNNIIRPNKDAGGLESKAYTALVGLKLRHPGHKFLYEEDPDSKVRS